ncbi:hypothetical protein 8P_061 [Pseudomonas phage 8P]|nr:hypothetical protein 8P_061 [Pseudomonas phage 8P]
MNIVKFRLWRDCCDPERIERVEFARATNHYYIAANGTRTAKRSGYYQFFDREQDAMFEADRRKREKAERIALRRVEGCGPELLEALENLLHPDSPIWNDFTSEEDVRFARIAIAKARGEQA